LDQPAEPHLPMRFTRQAMVLKEPLLVFIAVTFTVGLILAALWPGDESTPAEPMAWWAWLFWLVVLAGVALGIALLCHAEEIVVDAAQQRVTQTHRFLHHAMKTQDWRFSDFSAVAVTLHIDKEEQGSATPTGAATVGNARSVYTRRYELSLQRPDMVAKAAQRTITAPAHALDIPLPSSTDPLEVETMARTLAAIGGWPAMRQHYSLRLTPKDGQPYTVKVAVGADEPLT
jgi:hypothetical protein